MPTAERSRKAKTPKSCHERALGLLAVRPRSRRELERRLLGARFDAEEVEDVLGRLERVGLVDDAAFARQFAEHRFGSRKEGERAVVNGLRAAGVAPSLAGVDPAKAFGRLSSFLIRRGYGPETARAAARKALELSTVDD